MASNEFLRKQLLKICHLRNLRCVFPPKKYCADNGVMIAWTGIEMLNRQWIDDYSMEYLTNWPLSQLAVRT